MARTIKVEIKGDASGLKGALGDAAGHLEGFGSKIGGALGTIGKVGGLITAGGVALAVPLLKDAVGAASDFNESVSKTAQIFGSGQMNNLLEWADGAAQGMGATRQQALDAASTFATFGKAAGFGGDDLVDFSTKLTGLSGDFASFFNASPQEGIEAIGAALRGESEPIRRFGVMLNEDSLKATALSHGLVKAEVDTQKLSVRQEAAEKAARAAAKALKEHGAGSVEYTDALRDQEQAEAAVKAVMEGKVPQLTQAQKMQAAYLSILEQSKDAQGDFARTSDGLANKQRILAARFQNAKQELGAAFLPIMLKGVDIILTHVIPAFDRFAEWVGKVVYMFRDAGWKEAAKEVLLRVGDVFSTLGAWIRDSAAPAIWAATKELAHALADWVKDPAWPWLVEHLGEWLSAFGGWLTGTALPWLWEQTKALAGALASWVADPAVPWLLEHLGEWLSAFGGWFTGTALPWLGEQAVAMAKKLGDWVEDAADGLKRNLPTWLRTFTTWVVTDAIPTIVTKMAEAGWAMANWVADSAEQLIKNLPGWIWRFANWWTSDGFPALLNIGAGVAGHLASGIWSALTFMADIADAIVDGIIDGLWRLSGKLASAAGDMIKSAIPDKIADVLGINSPSKVMFELGSFATEGMRLGLESGRATLSSSTAGMAQTVTSAAVGGAGSFSPVGPIQVVLDGKVIATAMAPHQRAYQRARAGAF